jgi:hypothetical protein
MARPWTAALALRLLEQQAEAEAEAVVAALDAPVGPLAASCPPPPETHLVCVHGLPDGHPRRGVLGVYVRTPEEVCRRGVALLAISPLISLPMSPYISARWGGAA